MLKLIYFNIYDKRFIIFTVETVYLLIICYVQIIFSNNMDD